MTQPTKTDQKETSTSALQKKYGGIPLWIYIVALGVGILLFIYYKRKAAASTTTTDTSTQSAATVPPFINQVYTNPTPPESSAPGMPDKDDKKTKEVSTPKAETIRKVAGDFKIPIAELEKLNPGIVAKYLNTGKRVPKGTKLKVYA